MDREGQFKQMVLHGRDVVVHSGVEKGQHDFLLDEGQPVYFSFGVVSFHVIVDGLARLKPDNFLEHFLEHALRVFSPRSVPPFLHPIPQFIIPMGNDLQHDVQTFLVLELPLLIEGKNLLVIHDLNEVASQDSEASFDMCVHVVTDIVLFDFVSGGVSHFVHPYFIFLVV